MDHAALLEAHITDLLSRKARIAVAIDGMAASGKTTLAGALARRIPHCAVVHMDDFTIPLDHRAPGYFDAELSNADVSRFDREVLSPFAQGLPVRYRPYICHPQPGFLSPVDVPQDTRVLLVEGAYCLHPRLFGRYDLRVLCTVGEQAQRERILARNGAQQLAMFESLWIPMENRHILARNLRKTCDLVLT